MKTIILNDIKNHQKAYNLAVQCENIEVANTIVSDLQMIMMMDKKHLAAHVNELEFDEYNECFLIIQDALEICSEALKDLHDGFLLNHRF